MDCFLKCSPFIVTEFNDVCLGSCHCHHRRFLFSITRNGIIWNNYLAEYISVTTLVGIESGIFLQILKNYILDVGIQIMCEVM